MSRFVSLPLAFSIQSQNVTRTGTVPVAVNVDHVRFVIADHDQPETRSFVHMASDEGQAGFHCTLPAASVLELLRGAPESLAGVDSHAFDGRTVCRLIGEAEGEQWKIVQEIRHADGMVETSEISDGHTPAPADAREVLAAEIARCILESDGLFPRTFRWESAARIVEDWS